MADEIRHDIPLHTFRHDIAAPNIDGLREAGTTFRNAFCQTPTCCPSRGSVFAGKYPQQLGLYNHSCLLPSKERTMGHHFADHDFDTVAFGKTHNMNPGFKSVTYDIEATMGSTNHGYNVSDEDAVGFFDGPEDEFCDFVAVSQFADYLDTRSEGNFMAYIGIYSPHPPIYPPKRFLDMYDWQDIELPPPFPEEEFTKPEIHDIPRQRWTHLAEDTQRKITAAVLGMCTLVDECVGQIVSSLEDHGLLEDTIIVFTSDHGDQMGEHSMLGKFFNTYEGSLRVPLVVRVPGGGYGRGTERYDLVELVDLYPTLCTLCGVPLPETPYEIVGKDLFSGPTERRYVHSMIEHAHMVRSDRYKLTLFDNDRSELYDLGADPDERYNLYGRPELANVQLELTTQIVQHLTTYRPANHRPGRNQFFG